MNIASKIPKSLGGYLQQKLPSLRWDGQVKMRRDQKLEWAVTSGDYKYGEGVLLERVGSVLSEA